MQLSTIPKKPRCIFIDWNKTLSYSLFWGHLKDTHSEAKLLPTIEEWLFKDNRAIIEPWMRGQYSTKEIISKMAKGIQKPESLLLNELAWSCINMAFCSDKVPALVRTIQQKNIKVVVATDNMDTFREFTIPAMQLDSLFDDFLISSEMGVLKNDIVNERLVFFESFLQKHHISYEEVVLLDDSYDTFNLYRGKGFPVILIDGSDSLINTLSQYMN